MTLSEQTPATGSSAAPMAPQAPGQPRPRVPAIFAILAAVVIVALAVGLFALRQRPADTGHGTRTFPLPEAHVGPVRPTVGPDGNIWFIEEVTDKTKVVRITPNGDLTEFALPADSPNVAGAPSDIVAGPDGNLWLTIHAFHGSSDGTPAGAIGRMTTSGDITEYPLPIENRTFTTPAHIAVGPDHNLWFTASVISLGNQPGTDESYGAIGRITSQGSITLFTMPAPWTDPFDIVAGGDGQLWFTTQNDDGSKSAIGSITTSGTVRMYSGPASGLHVAMLAAAPDGSLWVGETDLTSQALGGAIGRVEHDGTITEYRLPAANTAPFSLTFAPDGTLWVALVSGDGDHDALGRVSPSGAITEFPLPARTTPSGLVWGPDGNLWVTELTANAIARINPPK
ncbi:MAG TPA: hypothetical protein VFY89_01540 [Ktedonobacterales bacterium]